MKKILVLLLAVTFVVFGTASIALATEDGWFHEWRKGSRVDGDIIKAIVFTNDATALSGTADAAGNISSTAVASDSEAKASDDEACAGNESIREVVNEGTAEADTADADALNQANNSEEEEICESAETHVDTAVCIDAEIDAAILLDDIVSGAGLGGDLDGENCDLSDCCPADVSGDIEIAVVYDNAATAITGDAIASGNISDTLIASDDKALACGTGVASNKSSTKVGNFGDADANSGKAVATNLSNNNVNINICRESISTKEVDIFIEFLLELEAELEY